MKVSDVMSTAVISVPPTALIAEAARLMLDNHISGLPVVDGSGNLVGIVTEGDFLRRNETGNLRRRPHWLEFCLGPGRLADEYVHTHGRKVEEVMTRKVVSTGENASLGEVASLMERHRVKRLPVLHGRQVVGIVSRASLLHPLMVLMSDPTPPLPDDGAIRSRILAAVKKEPWGPRYTINVVVRDGTVDLWGTIFYEREREALRVLVENIPGVKSVRDHLVWIEPLSGMVFDAPAEDGHAPHRQAS
jgi:CBS domain-containing protein